jgi:hypothetical protein
VKHEQRKQRIHREQRIRRGQEKDIFIQPDDAVCYVCPSLCVCVRALLSREHIHMHRLLHSGHREANPFPGISISVKKRVLDFFSPCLCLCVCINLLS